MSRFLGVAALAAVATVTTVIGYVAYRVKTGKSTVSVIIKNTDSDATATSDVTATEPVDPLVEALKAQAEKEIREYVEYLQVTKPYWFNDLEINYHGRLVALSKGGRSLVLNNIVQLKDIYHALEEIQQEPETEE